ncbi:MAG: TonB-dependent receptor [Planctomycetes bacterium]|nr:TonB-dependent receptor [Planctomycetota bacterium]
MRMAHPAALFAAMLFIGPLAAQETPPTDAKKDFTAPDIKVTSPSGTPTNNLDTPEAVTTLEKRRIEERGFGQVPDLLEGTTGVFVQHTANGQGSPFIRSLTGKQITMMVNGVRFNNSAFRSGPNQYYSSIDANNIWRIEVLRGPASVLYGSDTQGGVLSIYTYAPLGEKFDFSFGARPRYGSAGDDKRFNLFGEVTAENFGGYISGTYADVDELDGGSGIGRQPHTEYEEWGVYGSLAGRFANHKLTLTYSHFQQVNLDRTDAVSNLVANPALLPGGGTLSREIQNIFPVQADDLAILRWDIPGSGILETLYVNFSYHRVQEDLLRTPRSGTPTRRNQGFNVHTLGANALAVLNFGELSRLTLGAEVYHDMIHSRRSDQNLVTGTVAVRDNQGQFPDWCQYTSLGLYAQDEIWLVDNTLLVRPGVRFSAYRAQADVDLAATQLDGVNETFSDITGALAFVYRPVHEFALNLSLARGFRAPNLDDLAASKGTGAGNEIPNPDLEPEDQYSVELGAKWLADHGVKDSAAPYWLSGGVSFFFSYFDNAFRRVPATFNGAAVVKFDNSGRYRIFGMEAEASWYLTKELGLFGLPTDHVFFDGDALGASVNFSWMHGDDIKNEEPVARITPLMIEASLRYEAMHGKVYIEPFTQFVGRQDQIPSGNKGDVRFTPHDEPSYWLFGMRAGWYPVRNFRVNFSLNNIGNRAYHGLGNGTFGPGTNAVISLEIKW